MAALLAVLVGALLPLCCGCGSLGLEDSEPPHSENYSVSEGTQVTIQSRDVDGDIRVETWGKDYVQLTWTKSTTAGKPELANAEVEVTQEVGRLDIQTKLLKKDTRVSVDYDIKLPRNVLLTKVEAGNGNTSITGTDADTIVVAKSGDILVKNSAGYIDITAEKGNLRLEGTTGGAKLTTADSAIDVINTDGDVKATTSNGSITVTGCKGNVTLETSRGGIRVSDLQGHVLLARTADGPIEISNVTAVDFAQTSNADIKAEINSVGVNGTTIAVDSGSIGLYLSINLDANIEIKTLSGQVAINSYTGTLSVTGEFSPQHFNGVVGSGGNKIFAETSKGQVDVYASDTTQ